MPKSDMNLLRESLKPDCANCFCLCYVAFHYLKSEDFPIDKPAGQPCVHLADSYACNIHSELREQGFKGCMVSDCLGAGQFVSQVTFHGRSWWESDVDGARMIATIPIMSQVHELLLYITDILTGEIPEHDARLLETLLGDLLAFRELPPEQLTGTALMAFRQRARPVFVRLSQHTRA